MRIVAALGGNALLRRGEPLTIETQQYHAQRAATALNDAYGLLTGRVGTRVCTDIGGISFERPAQDESPTIV